MPDIQLIRTPQDYGNLLSSSRKGLGHGVRTQARQANVGTRFLTELEKGKETAQLGRAMQALHAAGYELAAIPVKESAVGVHSSLSQRVGTEFPYDWSNSRMSEGIFIRKVLAKCRYADIVKTVRHFGFERVATELRAAGNEIDRDRVASALRRVMLGMVEAQLTPTGTSSDQEPANQAPNAGSSVALV